MKYFISINQKRSVEWELTTSEAVVFSWLYELASWAEKLIYNGNTYYFGSRSIACKELPMVTDKPDTMYRLYKSLEKKDLISMITLEKKDYIALTEKGKFWYYEDELPSLGKKSEEIRNEIRENSEKNPTYQYNNNKYINNQEDNNKERIDKSIPKKGFDFKRALLDLGIDEDIVNDWLLVRKQKKATNTETAFKRIKNEIALSGISANECITLAVERCWMGFKAEWVKNATSSYKSQNNSLFSQQPNIELHPELKQVDEDGTLNDGTYVKNGYRYYFSKSSMSAISIPPKAEPKPQGNNFEYDYKLGWYECE